MYLLLLQIIISLTLVTIIILQAKGGNGLSGVLGGSTNYHAKRGVEKSLFYSTLVVSVLFVVLAMVIAL